MYEKNRDQHTADVYNSKINTRNQFEKIFKIRYLLKNIELKKSRN